MNKNIVNKENIRKISLFLGVTLISSTIILIIFFPSTFNPDFIGYKTIYLLSDEYIKKPGNIFLFSILNNLFKDYISYENFRVFLAILQIFFYVLIFNKLNFKLKNFGFFISLPLISFLFLKVHVQVRESLAMLFWFYVILDIKKYKGLSFKKISAFIFSIFMHSGTVILWIPSIVYFFGNSFQKYKKVSIYLFFFLITIFACSTYLRFLFNGQYEYLELINLSNAEKFLNPINNTLNKNLYRLTYVVLFSLIYYEEIILNSNELKSRLSKKVDYIFGFLSLNGLLIVIPTVTLFGIIFKVDGYSYNLIFRLSSILFLLLSFYRTLNFPTRFLTLLLNSFLTLDIIRLLFIAKYF